jgi:hypothetical protein
MGMQLIEKIEVGAGGSSSLNFTNIAQDAVDLVVLVSARNSAGNFGLRFNGDSASNYPVRALYGTGNTTGPNSYTSNRAIAWTSSTSYSADAFGSTSFYISNYTATGNKSVSIDFVSENNASTTNMGLNAAQWNGTAAITSIEVNGTGFVEFTTANLYSITAD